MTKPPTPPARTRVVKSQSMVRSFERMESVQWEGERVKPGA